MKYQIHGLSRSPSYKVWIGIKTRCLDPSNPAYPYYGGRGITICDKWKSSFLEFYKDMGDRPKDMTIDRIDNNGPYAPDNCRWISRKAQMLNRRNTVFLVIEGVRYTAHELAEMAGMKTDSIIARAKKVKTLKELLNPTRRIFYEGLAMTPYKKTNTHCRRGHLYTVESTYWTPAGYRQCKICRSTRHR